MRESEERELEVLKTTDDYFNEIARVLDLSSDLEGSKSTESLDDIVILLSKATHKKYKYVVNISSKWRRKQSLLSKIRESIKARKERNKEEEENTSEPPKEELCEGTLNVQQELPLIDNNQPQQELLEF